MPNKALQPTLAPLLELATPIRRIAASAAELQRWASHGHPR